MPAPQAAAEAMPDSPRLPRPSTANGRPAMRVPARLVRPYTRHGRDGRDWNKMIIRLPQGTTVDGRHWDWWNIDRFMNPRQQQAHARGEDIMVTFKPGEQVELWRGKGPQRRAETIDATALCEAVGKTLHPDRDAPADQTATAAPRAAGPELRARLARLETEQPDLCARASDLCMHAIEHDWPRIERLQQRLLEHARQGRLARRPRPQSHTPHHRQHRQRRVMGPARTRHGGPHAPRTHHPPRPPTNPHIRHGPHTRRAAPRGRRHTRHAGRHGHRHGRNTPSDPVPILVERLFTHDHGRRQNSRNHPLR